MKLSRREPCSLDVVINPSMPSYQYSILKLIVITSQKPRSRFRGFCELFRIVAPMRHATSVPISRSSSSI